MVIPALYWVVWAFILVIVEIVTLTFASFWFAISALAVAMLTFFYPKAMSSWQIQVLFWLIFSILIIASWFKGWQPYSVMRKKTQAMKDGKLINEQGVITKPPTSLKAGVMRFHIPFGGANEWKCRSKGHEEINFGDRVTVIDIDIDNEELIVSLIRK